MKMQRVLQDLLGAHVSTQGGVAEAPARGSRDRSHGDPGLH